MGRITISPFTTTGLSLMACMPEMWSHKLANKHDSNTNSLPRTAACGRLIIGVPYREPNTPPLDLDQCEEELVNFALFQYEE